MGASPMEDPAGRPAADLLALAANPGFRTEREAPDHPTIHCDSVSPDEDAGAYTLKTNRFYTLPTS